MNTRDSDDATDRGVSTELCVGDLMTRELYTLSPSQSLPLAEAMMELERVRHLPVIDDAGDLVGLVTHRDLLAAKISALTPLTADERSTLELAVPVSRVMRRDVWTIGPKALAVVAARIMRDHRFGCLPVVEENGMKLVGILCEADLLTLVTDSIELVRPHHPLQGGVAVATTVARAMTPAPITITPLTSIAEARSLMSRYRVRHLPVLENLRAVALVSDRDLRVAEIVYQQVDLHRASAKHAARLIGTDTLHRARANDALEDVFRMMFEKRIDAVVVEDDQNDNRLVGVLTSSDACRLLGQPRSSCDSAQETTWTDNGNGARDRKNA